MDDLLEMTLNYGILMDDLLEMTLNYDQDLFQLVITSAAALSILSHVQDHLVLKSSNSSRMFNQDN